MLPTTEVIESLLKDTVKKPQLILEVDGLPLISSTPSQTYAYYGQQGLTYGMEGLVYGGLAEDQSALPYIDLGKSTNNITQQLLIDKGGFTSTTNFDISVIDVKQIITEMITPQKYVNDVLGKKARIYLSFEGAGHPEDSILFFSGIVSDLKSGSGYVNFNISSPEKLKNSEIFPKITTELTSAIGTTDTTVTVSSTSNFILPTLDGTIESYIKIGDEIIKFTGISGNSFTGCTRAQFDTIAQAHSIDDSVDSYYRLKGNLKDLSLKLMLSDGGSNYLENISALSINNYGTFNLTNAVFIPEYNIDQKYGVTTGDTLTISGALNSSNNGSGLILDFKNTIYGTYVLIDKTLVNEGSGAKIAFKSKYNVFPKFAGIGMTPDQVDVQEFESIYTQYASKFFEYDYYIKDAINGSDFINQKILYPSGCYAIPRKAKTSIGIMTPPLAKNGTKKLSNINVINPSSIKINRSISKNFYNAIAFRYDMDAVEDKFLRNKIYVSEDSVNRVGVPYNPRIIEADGVRKTGNFDAIFNSQATRFLNRYQFGAESLDVQVPFGEGFTLEIGDTVILDGRELQISDTKDFNGTRSFLPRLFEVTNISKSMRGTPITLSLLDTAYSLSGRYGVIAPSSRINVSSSTTTRLKLNQSDAEVLSESVPTLKWANYIGENVIVHDKEWVWQQTVKLESLDPADPYAVIVSPALVIPMNGVMIMEAPKYPENSDKTENATFKASHVYFNKTHQLTNNCTDTQLEIVSIDAPLYPAGIKLFIHNKDFTQTAYAKVKELSLSSVSPSFAILENALPFTPDENFKVELLGYFDGGAPYLWL